MLHTVALLANHAFGGGGGVGCFTFNSMWRSRSCFGSTVLGESVIRQVPFVAFGNENPNGIPAYSPRLRRRSYLGLSSPHFANPNGVAAIR